MTNRFDGDVAALVQTYRDGVLTSCTAAELAHDMRALAGARSESDAALLQAGADALTALQTRIDRLRDWQATVTAAIGKPGGCHFDDVASEIRLRALQARVLELEQVVEQAEARLSALRGKVVARRDDLSGLRHETDQQYHERGGKLAALIWVLALFDVPPGDQETP